MNLPRSLALTIAIVLLAAAASPAFAGEYPVYACEPGAGDVNRSWVAEINHGGMTAYSNCPPPGNETRSWNRGLVARHAVVPSNPNATIPQGAQAAVAFYAPPGTALARITYSHELCSLNGYQSGLVDSFGRWLLYSWSGACGSIFPTQGTVDLGGASVVRLVTQCRFGPCPVGGGNLRAWATMRAATVVVRDYSAPHVAMTGGSALAAGWRRGVVDVGVSAADNVGIRYADVLLGGKIADTRSNVCDYTLRVPCPGLGQGLEFNTRLVPDGRHTLVIRAQDSANNWSTASRSILLDNSAPVSPIGLGIVGGNAWRQRNAFSIGWRNPSQAGAAPIAGVETAVCPVRNGPEVWTGCVYGRVATTNVTAIPTLRVPRAGQWVGRIWLRDAAGNHDPRSAVSVPLRLDDSAPQLAFQLPDPNDPARIDVRASDAISGLSRTEIEIRRRGTASWTALATTRSPAGFFAYLDDEHLGDGVYDLRARAVDMAGNERSTDRDAAGRLVTRAVPVRINTRLVAGQVKRRTAKRSRGGRRRTRRVIVVRPTVRFGRTIPIRGRLTTPGANPIANATVEVWERLGLPGARWRRIALIGTTSEGRFRFKALRGPSRVLRFRYPGTALVRARTTEVDIHVKAGSTMRSSRKRVVNGDEVVFRGKVLGRPLPATGKLVKLQAYSRGRWLTFATPRASANTGRWSYRYRFTATRGTVRYRFRAELPREAGYPYDAGSSRRVSVIVRGL
jgi:hypothetical protein